MIDLDAIVRTNLREMRKARQWSQQTVADQITRVRGVQFNQSQLAKLERGERRCMAEDIAALAEAFGVDAEAFLRPGAASLLPIACHVCNDAPPAGFTCNACGAIGGAA